MRLPCIVDGLDGPLCDDVVESFCVNQCSGHGECNLGYCKCDPGAWGRGNGAAELGRKGRL